MKNLIPFFFVMLLGISCAPKDKVTEQPNIVWITSEDNSTHYMSLFDEHGANTPNIEKLADKGVKFAHAFSNAAVCSAARSTLISGCYGPRLGSHYHRNIKQVSMPEGLAMFPAYLKAAGYYTTNNSKEDYNIPKSDTVWDQSSKKASWRNRAEGQPFFHVFNIGTTHESRLHFTKEQMDTTVTQNNPDESFVFPNHPQTDLFKYTNAWYRDKIQQMDKEVGEVIEELKKDTLLENTFIFYYGDHGGVLPGSKGYLYESGLHVPLVVYIPEKYKHLVNFEAGETSEGFVSFVDFGATVLSLAGIEIPEKMDGKPFLGKNISKEEVESRDETFSYADRFDEKYDMVRAYRKGKYKYIRNYQPYNFDGMMNNYRYKQLAYQQWWDMYKAGDLNDIQKQFFETKPAEALYDLDTDPYETNNLAANNEYGNVIIEMREGLNNWIADMPDLSFYPEHYLVENAFENPEEFGEKHRDDILKYAAIADLALSDYAEIQDELEQAIHSEDSWDRYWGLSVCTSFGDVARNLTDKIKEISLSDPELLNRVQAAAYLGLFADVNPEDVMLNSLYSSNNAVEALSILNSIVLMRDGAQAYTFNIDRQSINKVVLADMFIKWRLSYLEVL